MKVLILICALAIPRSECQPETSIDIIDGPVVQNEMMCGLMGQTTIATTQIKPVAGEEYQKTICVRESSEHASN